MFKRNSDREGADLDAALAAAEGEPAGRLLQEAGEWSHPRPEFVHQLHTRLRQQATATEPPVRPVRAGRRLAGPARPVVLAAVILVLVAGAAWGWFNQSPP